MRNRYPQLPEPRRITILNSLSKSLNRGTIISETPVPRRILRESSFSPDYSRVSADFKTIN